MQPASPNPRIKGIISSEHENKHRITFFFELMVYFSNSVMFLWLIGALLTKTIFSSNTEKSKSSSQISSILLISSLKVIFDIFFDLMKAKTNPEVSKFKQYIDIGFSFSILIIPFCWENWVTSEYIKQYSNDIELFYITIFNIWNICLLAIVLVFFIIEVVRFWMNLRNNTLENHVSLQEN